MAGKVGASRGTVIADDHGSDKSGMIDPAFFPELKPEQLYNAANNLRKMGTGLRDGGEAVNSAWRQLQAPGCYEAPEQDEVYALQQPTVKETAAMHDDLFEAARLIGALANDYKAIEPDLTALAVEAAAFRIKALAGWPAAEEYPEAGYTGDGPGGYNTTDQSYVPFSQSNKAHEKNNQLLERLKDIKARIVAAETTCADGLRMIDPVLGAPPPDSGKYKNLKDDKGNSLGDDYAGAAGPWGFPTKTKGEGCAARAYYGLFQNPIDSIFETIAALVVGYDPRTGQCSNEGRTKAWENMASINLAILIVGLFGSNGDPGALPPEVKQWIREQQAIGARAINDTVGYDPDPAPGQGHWHAWDENFWDLAGRAAWGVGGLALAAAAPLLGVARAFGVSLLAGITELGIAVTDWVTMGGVSLVRLGFTGLGKLVIRAVGGGERLAGDFGLLVDAQRRVFVDLGDGRVAPVSRILGADGRVLSLEDFAIEAKVGGAGRYTIVLEDGRSVVLTPGSEGVSELSAGGRSAEPDPADRTQPDTEVAADRGTADVDLPGASGGAEVAQHQPPETSVSHPASSDPGPAAASPSRDGAHPGSHGDPPPAHVDAPEPQKHPKPSGFTEAQVREALAEAPRNEAGEPLDHRSGAPLRLHDVDGDRGWVMHWDEDAGRWVAQNRRADGSPSGMPLTGEGYGYGPDGKLLRYAEHRPPYGRTQVLDVWRKAVAQSPDGRVVRPALDENGVRYEREIVWTPGESRDKNWDMGHRRGDEYAVAKDLYMRGELTEEQFLEWYQNPDNYDVQDWRLNRSHVDELPRSPVSQGATRV